jgi:glycosyltransferase involved in cell wall biosynthesis
MDERQMVSSVREQARGEDDEKQPTAHASRALPRIAVVIPAYRVQDQIAQVLAGLPDLVSTVVVVDDHSPDESSARVAALPGGGRVVLLRHQQNQGVGGAMLTGYREAIRRGAEILVKMDGDGQMDPAFIPALVAPIVEGEADYTKGNRLMHLSELRQMPGLRRLGNFGLSFMAKLASGYWDIFDPTNGFTAIHRDFLLAIDERRIARRYFFEISMLLELRRLGAVVADVAMPARYAGETSSLSLSKSLFGFPPRMVSGALRRLARQYFLYDFNAASIMVLFGIPLLLFGAAWGIYHWIESVSTNVPATTGTVLISVLPLIIGTQFLVQALVLDINSVPRASRRARRSPDEVLNRLTAPDSRRCDEIEASSVREKQR